ncbi:MAG: hypothetical protein R2734_10480 [Nocardioides sp.]
MADRHRGPGAHRCATSTIAVPPARCSATAPAPPAGAGRVPPRGDRPRACARRAAAVGTAFLAGDAEQVAKSRQRVEKVSRLRRGLAVLAGRRSPWTPRRYGRDRPLGDADLLPGVPGRRGPRHRDGPGRRAFCLRKRAEQETDAYFPSLSSRTLVYKGMLTTDRLDTSSPASPTSGWPPRSPSFTRFSTNTFPSWPLARPFRFIAHNGEINTVMGNRNWMRAREALLASDLIPGDLERLYPICTPGASDSASFDEVLELLHAWGAGAAVPSS